MAVPSNMLLEAAARARRVIIVSVNEMRNNFEWAWGLRRGTFDEHLSSYPDLKLVEILLNDNFIVVAQPDLIGKIYRAVPRSVSWRFSSKERVEIQDLYKGCQMFEYLVIPIDTPSAILPRVVLSPIPPHLTVSFAVDKIFKRRGYVTAVFREMCDLLVKFVGDASIYGATFSLEEEVFFRLKYVHVSWTNVIVPRRFLGLEGSVDEEASDGDSGSSTMEWDAHMLPDEPHRRLFPDELKHDPVLKFWTPAADEDEDDVTSWDSHITGVGDPEESAKVSMARGDYLPDRAWMKGVESWVKSTSGIINDQTLTNDGQIEDRSDEPSRAAASLDLQQPDFWQKFRPVMRARPLIG